jgi:hypothetical protein
MTKDKERMECPCCGQAVKGKEWKRVRRWAEQLHNAEALVQRLSSIIAARVERLREADARDPEGAAELRRLVEKHVEKPGWQEVPQEEVLKEAQPGARTFKWNAATPADVKREKALREAQKAKQEIERREKNRIYARKYYQEHKATIDRRQRDRKARARANARSQVKSSNGGKSVH